MNHVADRAGLIIEISPPTHANRFGGGNLHVIDVAVIPDRFENRVGETEHQQPLHQFLGEVVVDAVNRVFLERPSQRAIERCGALGVHAEGLLHDDPLPRHLPAVDRTPSLALGDDARLIDALNDGFVQRGRDGKIKQDVARNIGFGGERFQPLRRLLQARSLLFLPL